jgi:endonuclease/exonuclease/phosphatase family metal-dependent hydrolase
MKQADAIVAHLEKLEEHMPTVIMGDLNQWAEDGKCLVAFAKHHDVIPLGPSFHSRRPMLQLDRIITSRDFKLESAGVHRTALARTGSDHLPVWATLSLNRAEAAA